MSWEKKVCSIHWSIQCREQGKTTNLELTQTCSFGFLPKYFSCIIVYHNITKSFSPNISWSTSNVPVLYLSSSFILFTVRLSLSRFFTCPFWLPSPILCVTKIFSKLLFLYFFCCFYLFLAFHSLTVITWIRLKKRERIITGIILLRDAIQSMYTAKHLTS